MTRRPAKNRAKKVIDDEDEDEAPEPEETKTPLKNVDTTTDAAKRTTAMHSEVTSSRGIGGEKDDDGSVKSLKR